MAWLTRDEVKEIVCECLSEIGNFDGDCEEVLIAELTDQYIIDLGNCIQDKLNDRGFSVVLTVELIESKEKVSDLIDYIENNQQE